MITVSVLVLKNSVVASITDTQRMFRETNKHLEQSGKSGLFSLKLVAAEKEVVLGEGTFIVKPDTDILDNFYSDIVIIPALHGDMIAATYLNRAYASWLGKQYENGAEIASLCTGSFLLAFSGLLKDKECTTHWAYADEFRSYYPAVKLMEDRVFTSQGGLYTSGGNVSYWNLLLFLIEKYTDRQTAIAMSKFFLIDIDRVSQSPFVIFKGSRKHEDAVVLGIQEYIENHFSERLTVDDLALRFNLTRRTLERRFAKATRLTVAQYIQRVKIEAAKKMLETGRKSVSTVMVAVGYFDTQTFRENFKDFTGMTPVEYKARYNNG